MRRQDPWLAASSLKNGKGQKCACSTVEVGRCTSTLGSATALALRIALVATLRREWGEDLNTADRTKPEKKKSKKEEGTGIKFCSGDSSGSTQHGSMVHGAGARKRAGHIPKRGV